MMTWYTALALVVACLCVSAQAQPLGVRFGRTSRPAFGGLLICNIVVPSEVSNLQAYNQGDGQVQLKWDAPSNRPCGVSYNISAQPKGSGFQPRVATTAETAITPYGLLSGVRYVFTVQVRRAARP